MDNNDRKAAYVLLAEGFETIGETCLIQSPGYDLIQTPQSCLIPTP